MMKAPRSQLDRATIAVRSDCDRGVLPRNVWTVRWSVRRVDGSIAIKLHLMKITRHRGRQIAIARSSFNDDRAILVRPRVLR